MLNFYISSLKKYLVKSIVMNKNPNANQKTVWGKLVEFFYFVNYVNVNYTVKYSTVDCKYSLFLQDF